MSGSNPLLFERSTRPFDSKVWADPTAEYRGAPFWSWNKKLDKAKLLRQLEFMKTQMGMGGAYMHPRTGLDTMYMSDEYLDIMRACIDFCKQNDMLACLYDEDRWPSGAAGGQVSKANPEYRQQHLLVTVYPYGALPEHLKVRNPTKGQVQRSENGQLLAVFDLAIATDGLVTYRRLKPDDNAKGSKIYFYAESQPDEPWWNHGTYVDTLNPEAIQAFLQLTHERYHQTFGMEFGSGIPSIFTDEPQFTCKEYLSDSRSQKDLFLPWTGNLEATFKQAYGDDASLIDHLPELVWDVSDEPSLMRYRYHDHVCDRFVESYCDAVAGWCRSRGIALTGHMNGEPRLTTQTQSLGEAMRCYRNFDVPGIDILCDAAEYNTAKQASSVARQNGVRGLLSEMYGVTNWTFDFKGHKAQGDWQAALGVTVRVPHLFPVSIAGEAKRDYPAAIGYQSPWATQYRFIEDHFARIASVLTRGRPVTRVAVIHPIESFWLAWGPSDRNGAQQSWREAAFAQLTEWLLHSLIDFDFISESLFESQTSLEDIGKELPVGKCGYETVIVANCRTLRQSTVDRLQAFVDRGGRVIYAGEKPAYIDVAKKSLRLKGEDVPFTRWDTLRALEAHRDVRITSQGIDTQSLFYQWRNDGERQYVFMCDTEREDPLRSVVKLRGNWDATVMNTQTGSEWPIESEAHDGWTSLDWTFQPCGSLLLRLDPRSGASVSSRRQPDYEDGYNQIGKVALTSVSLSEPNVLLLDQATWRLDDGEWQSQEEVLKIDNLVRQRLKLPLKKDAFPQPWSRKPEERLPVATLRLCLIFESTVQISDAQVAVENLEATIINLDGQTFDPAPTGWFVDEDIPTVRLGDITPGQHQIELEIAFGVMTPIERVYLLGEFGVQVFGDKATLVPLDLNNVRFGDFTRQGLPFYAGNITYKCEFDVADDVPVLLQIHNFEGPAVTCIVDGQDDTRSINMSLQPHIADLGSMSPGRHTAEFTLYGNRENALGAIHMPAGGTDYWNPNAWRGDQNFWQDEYNLKPMGIMAAPVVRKQGKREYLVPVRRRHIEQPGWFLPPRH